MDRQITITLPEGYEHPEHIVLVASDEPGTKYVTVLAVNPDGSTPQVEEVGGGPLREGMIQAARVIRTGTAAVSR